MLDIRHGAIGECAKLGQQRDHNGIATRFDLVFQPVVRLGRSETRSDQQLIAVAVWNFQSLGRTQ